MERLPIGVVIPTFNCVARLPGHIAALNEWQAMVQEIVVVDSFSDDGTLDTLKQHLPWPHVRFTSHPRGLYPSWNFGISQVGAKYTYISTVGDIIVGDGLRHLTEVAEQFQADVAISPPRLIEQDGRPVNNVRWPIHRLIERNQIVRPSSLTPLQAFLVTALNAPSGILGSSASNLYRTRRLKDCPFSTDFGHCSDTAWPLRHALQTVWAVTPREVATFLMHPNHFNPEKNHVAALTERFIELARESYRKEEERGKDGAVGDLSALLKTWSEAKRQMQTFQERHDTRRKQSWPWIFSPSAWRTRAKRNQRRKTIARLTVEMSEKYGLDEHSFIT